MLSEVFHPHEEFETKKRHFEVKKIMGELEIKYE